MRTRPLTSVTKVKVSRTAPPAVTAAKRTATPLMPRESAPFTRATKRAARESPGRPLWAPPLSAVMTTGTGAKVTSVVSAIPVGVKPMTRTLPRRFGAMSRPWALIRATVLSLVFQAV